MKLFPKMHPHGTTALEDAQKWCLGIFNKSRPCAKLPVMVLNKMPKKHFGESSSRGLDTLGCIFGNTTNHFYRYLSILERLSTPYQQYTKLIKYK